METIVTEQLVNQALDKIKDALSTLKTRELELICTYYVDELYPGSMYRYVAPVSKQILFLAFDPLNLFDKPVVKRGEESAGYISIKVKRLEDIAIMFNGKEIQQ